MKHFFEGVIARNGSKIIRRTEHRWHIFAKLREGEILSCDVFSRMQERDIFFMAPGPLLFSPMKAFDETSYSVFPC